MAKIRAKIVLLGFCGLFLLGAGTAQAQGFRFGLWRYGPFLGAPAFGGPRYDGPRYRDVQPAPEIDSPDLRPHGPRTCYKPGETRERIAGQKLHEPFELMRKASGIAHAEALAVKLCHWNDIDIYEITLLRPDGRVIHVFMNAATGAVVGALNTH
jgi:hypothetical protein